MCTKMPSGRPDKRRETSIKKLKRLLKVLNQWRNGMETIFLITTNSTESASKTADENLALTSFLSIEGATALASPREHY